MSGVAAPPHTSVIRGHVKEIGLSRNAADRDGATAAKRTDHPPLQFAIKLWVKLLSYRGSKRERNEQQESHCGRARFEIQSLPPRRESKDKSSSLASN
jgi:hypothetical protein